MRPALAAFALTAAVLTAPSARAEEQAQPPPTWEWISGADVSVGRYGAASDTTVADVRLAAKLQLKSLRLEASLPFEYLAGPGELVDGVPAATGSGTSTSQRSGLGDLSLAAAYVVTAQKAYLPAVELGAALKLPTARVGIGTGKTDYAVVANLYETLSPRVMLFGTVGYWWLTSSTTYQLTSGATATAGINLTSANQNLGVSMTWREPVAQGLNHQLSVTPYLARRFAGNWGVTFYGTAGLTNASPRLGAGLWISLFR